MLLQESPQIGSSTDKDNKAVSDADASGGGGYSGDVSLDKIDKSDSDDSYLIVDPVISVSQVLLSYIRSEAERSEWEKILKDKKVLLLELDSDGGKSSDKDGDDDLSC